MKTRINKLLYIFVVLALLVSSCEWTPIMWDDSKVFVAFSQASTNIEEQGDSIGIIVAVTALDGAPSITVNFEFDTTGIDSADAAFEGNQFTLENDSKTLNYPDGWGFDTIWVNPADNDIFTGDKSFNISLTENSLDLTYGAISSHAVTLKDNEHPLAKWLGSYAVEALSYGNPGAWDEAWTVSSVPNPDDVSKLILTINDGDPFSATLDVEAMTITIDAGTGVGVLYGSGNGPVVLHVGDWATVDMESPIVGTIENDGTIKIDKLTFWLSDWGEAWDAFNSTWTKTGKKSLSKASVDQGKASRHK